ncbi:hypothetical protein [Methanosarcina horonobensis]|uniref:hypothetical protein n=1 Tax=Methanosarcina horonobensis TaxID=418008 RepID=UPI00138E03F8|nr:hypothetical protein [Methanosarcina horonobensis]
MSEQINRNEKGTAEYVSKNCLKEIDHVSNRYAWGSVFPEQRIEGHGRRNITLSGFCT